jgi:thioredoxin reductase (NADPH)
MDEEKRDLDVVIIGAGPAGLSAGIWCKDLGLTAVILEREAEPGGQLLSIYNPITNYPGLRTEHGRELRDRFLETAESYGVEILLSTEVVEIDTENTSILTAARQRFSARSIILATGVRRRRLNIPGETEFVGKGIIESGARDKELTRGKTVAIIGGGDAALENTLILSEYATKIYVIHRRDSFSAREDFVRQAAATRPVEFLPNTRVVRINGADSVESIEIIDQNTGASRTTPVDIVLIRIGVEPNSELLANNANLAPGNYVVIDSRTEPRAADICAIGDVANPFSLTISTAAGTAASAVKRIRSLYDNLYSFQ